jgi:hypothetical protein
VLWSLVLSEAFPIKPSDHPSRIVPVIIHQVAEGISPQAFLEVMEPRHAFVLATWRFAVIRQLRNQIPDINAGGRLSRPCGRFAEASARTYCERRFCKRLIRFSGCTRITPPRGLSMSAIRKKDRATAIGKTMNSMPVRCAP